jgi:hypothetical protein
MNPPQKLTIVAVHGVGDAKPGDICGDLSTNLEQPHNPHAVFERADLLIRGIQYPRLRAHNVRLGEVPVEEIVEVNWADVLRPAENPWQVLRHLFFLFIGMRSLSTQPVTAGKEIRIPWRARLYWASVELFLWWAALLALAVMLLSSCGKEHSHWLKAVALGAPVIVGIMAWWLGRFSSLFRAGFAWLPVFLAAGASFLWPGNFGSPDQWARWTGQFYAGGQLLVSVTLLLAVFEALFRLKLASWPKRFTRAGMLWIPFLILCGFAVANWVVSLLFGAQVLDVEAQQNWQSVFLKGLRYDLFWSEVGTLGAVAITFGLVPMIGIAAYFSPKLRAILHLPQLSGETAHHLFFIILAVGPVALIAGGMVFWISFFIGSSNTTLGGDILKIYSVSAIRISAVLPFCLPFARVILDVAGDVIFHLQAAESRLSSQPDTLPRLRKLLEVLRRERPNNKIMVLAHSQGSVIAWTGLRDESDLADILVTLGSPLSTLYGWLLDEDFGKELRGRKLSWKNIYRDGDYIGGRVDGCSNTNNQSLGKGDHINYWSDSRLIKHLS